ncbi:MAG: hypothetical protein PF588_05755, partial [Candidatus Kapabacteria bacterium]|nr:hypothetical protein [Candidatus Kapabacteria bacterium]
MLKKLLTSFSVALVAMLIIFSVPEVKADLIQDTEMEMDIATYVPLTSYAARAMAYSQYYTGWRLPFEFNYDDHVYPANTRIAAFGAACISFYPWKSGTRYPYYYVGRMASYYYQPTGMNNQAVTPTIYGLFGYCYKYPYGQTRFRVLGSPGSRIAVFEWPQQQIHYYYYVPTQTADVQIRLYEGSNKIEIHYGKVNILTGTTDPYWNYTSYGKPAYPIMIGLNGYQGPTRGSVNYVNVYPPGAYGFSEWTGRRSETDGITPNQDFGTLNNNTYAAVGSAWTEEGVRLTWGAGGPKLVDSYPANGAILPVGRMYPSSTDPNPPYTEAERAGAYVIRLDG